jgi:hypothetical protein
MTKDKGDGLSMIVVREHHTTDPTGAMVKLTTTIA